MTLGCMVWELPGMAFLDHVRWLAEQGFDAVDFHVNPELAPDKAIDLDTVDDDFLRELQATLEPFFEVGIHAAFGITLVSPDEAERNASLQYLERTIQFAHTIGARTVTAHKGASPRPQSREELRAIFADSLAHIQPVAQQHDVVVALEIEEDYDLVGAVGSPHLGVCVDTGHVCFHDGAGYREFGSIPGLLRHLGEHLVHIHIHDWDGESDHLPIGDGGHPWGEIVEALRDIDYQGAAILEVNPARNGIEGILRSKAALDPLVAGA